LHAAVPALYTIYFARQGDPLLRRLAPWLAIWTLGVAWSVVYGGEHYMIDAVIGVLWAAAVYVVFVRLQSVNWASIFASPQASDPSASPR
jgi:membrane-associated phospholipid phosphatase